MTIEPFERVVAEHGALVWRVCRAVVGPADADDAWSETFLAALAAYPGLRAGSDVRAWLVTIAHRKAIDQFRRVSRGPVPVGDRPDRPFIDPGLEPADVELWAAFDALSPRRRTAVAAHHLGGLSYAEVGALLGCSEAAARRSASDGIAALRRSREARRAS